MNSLINFQAVALAYAAATRAQVLADRAGHSLETVRLIIDTTNVLVDICVDLGMPTDEPDHEGWAANWLATQPDLETP